MTTLDSGFSPGFHGLTDGSQFLRRITFYIWTQWAQVVGFLLLVLAKNCSPNF